MIGRRDIIKPMIGTGKLKRLAAVFVLAFICLNAGGALCVAYCQGFENAAKEHAPALAEFHHCDDAETPENISGSATALNESDCCVMTVSFLGGPIEKDKIALDPVAAVVETRVERAASTFVSSNDLSSSFNYRGPPLDRRVDRLKHCIIRI